MRPNARWSLDCVSDQLTCGRRFRILTVVDDCPRECLRLPADRSLRARSTVGAGSLFSFSLKALDDAAKTEPGAQT